MKLLAALFVLIATSHAAKIAVIDSGTDLEHEAIAPYIWTNPVDNTDNFRDEDGNGYPDDIHGWNFAENNNVLIDYSYEDLLNDDIREFFLIQEKSIRGTVTMQEAAWYQEKINDKEFLKRMGTYGNFMHGSHVSAIAVKDNEFAELISIKLIPTEVKLPGQVSLNTLQTMNSGGAQVPEEIKKLRALLSEMSQDEEDTFMVKFLKPLFTQMAEAQAKSLENVADYVNSHSVQVANGSFGVGFKNLAQRLIMIYKAITGKLPSTKAVVALVIHTIETSNELGKAAMEAAPKTLFVFAAGNDGMSNDDFSAYPANIESENIISVAATVDHGNLAPFSNFGTQMVDIAAPGVGINSATPGSANDYIKVSGTSQAAPYVANIAGLVYDANPGLTPAEIKEILMGTVDKKFELSSKVASGGVANIDRAVYAAKLSKTVGIRQAISRALSSVDDIEEDKIFTGVKNGSLYANPAGILPLPSPFKF